MKENRRIIVENWFREYKDIFKGNGVDRWLKFPEGTMQKFFKYNTRLNNKRINKAYREITKLTKLFEDPKIDQLK
jgi:ketol-acid reductoisomerase